MKKLFAIILFIAWALIVPGVHAQSAQAGPRGGPPLPQTCSPGGANAAADTIVSGGVYYICTAPNKWTAAHGPDNDNSWSNNNRFCGPDPWADISCFGARAPEGGFPTATANCVKGSNQIVIATPHAFQLNDGVTIYGCGASNTMATPSDIKVTPSEPWGLADTRSAMNGPPGNSTYTYTIVARDIYGALSAPATPVEIHIGQATLGPVRAALSTLTRKDDRITVVTKEPNNLVVGALVHLQPNNSQQFAGWYNVAKVDSPTQFELWTTSTDTRAQGWMVGDTVSYSGGGFVAYYQENYLKWPVVKGAWEYYVCAKRPGENELKLIGVTKPTGLLNGYTDVGFEDYGSPYMDGQIFPSYVTSAICTGAATNDPLTTWVTGVAGDGVTYTLHDAAIQTASRKTIVFDDAPGILRALNSISSFNSAHGTPGATDAYIGGAIYIPPARSPYVINSYLPVPRQVTIWQSGKLTLNETVSLASSDNWFGDWSSQGTPQFGGYSGAGVYVNAASPGLYLMGTGNTFRGLNLIDQNSSGGTLLVADNAAPSNFTSVNFLTGAGGSAKDYTGMTVVLRDTTSTISEYHFTETLISTGPDQVDDKSWSPAFWIAPPQAYGNNGLTVVMDKTSVNRRGIAFGGAHGGDGSLSGPFRFVTNWSYRQGGIIPYFTCMACAQHSPITFNDASQDTEGQPLEAALLPNPNSGYLGPHISAHDPTGGTQAPLFSGLRPSFAEISSLFNKASAIQNRDVLYKTGGNFQFVYAPYATTGTFAGVTGSLYTVGMPMHGVGGYSWWFDLSVPTNVAATAEPGGGVPAGTWVYAITAVGADSGETIMSVPSPPVSISAGTQNVRVKWTPSLGAYSYNVWRCETKNPCISPDGSTSIGTGPWLRVALHTSGTTYSDAEKEPTRYNPPTVTGTGSTIVNGTGAYAPFFQAPPITVSQLPSASTNNSGQMRRVTDSTAINSEGQTCAGGGSAAALAFSNGKVWKCF